MDAIWFLKRWIARRKLQSWLGLGEDFQPSKSLLKDQSAPYRLNQCFPKATLI
jgi:hypothetical protein